jgi:hypothetical protein|eukprot:COSAG01_NODE_570_length_15328_cov_82.520783_10_plen_185_part_00
MTTKLRVPPVSHIPQAKAAPDRRGEPPWTPGASGERSRTYQRETPTAHEEADAHLRRGCVWEKAGERGHIRKAHWLLVGGMATLTYLATAITRHTRLRSVKAPKICTMLGWGPAWRRYRISRKSAGLLVSFLEVVSLSATLIPSMRASYTLAYLGTPARRSRCGSRNRRITANNDVPAGGKLPP